MNSQCILCDRCPDDWKLYHVIRPDNDGGWERVGDRRVCGRCIRSVVYGMFREAPADVASPARENRIEMVIRLLSEIRAHSNRYRDEDLDRLLDAIDATAERIKEERSEAGV